MTKLHIDIETFSSVDLRTAGVYKYCRSVDFEVLILAYRIDYSEVKVIDLAQDEKIPKEFKDAFFDKKTLKIAHNAQFERQCLAQIGLTAAPEQWECTSVKAAYCGFPLSLENVSIAMDLQEKGKEAKGKALIKYFSVPCKPTKVNGNRHRNLPNHDIVKWVFFKNYCKQDVIAECEIYKRLEAYEIPKFERLNYINDQYINDRGVLIDIDFVKKAIEKDFENTAILKQLAKKLTGLENPNSPAQLGRWLTVKLGKPITSIAKGLIENLISSDIGGVVLEVLKIRQKMSKSSVKKYKAMQSCASDTDNRARGLFQFYGATRTGRWAGRLIQLQNLPRNAFDEMNAAKDMIKNLDYESLCLFYDDIGSLLSNLIRSAIIAPKDKTFAVADFSAIEARILSWLAGEKWRLDVFNSHGKIYEASASLMFGVPIEQCSKDAGNGYRDKGKVAELALGYQGGVGALVAMGGSEMGLSESDMTMIVDRWRNANPKIKKLWYSIGDAAIKVVKANNPNSKITVRGIEFSMFKKALCIKLPSSRCLFYQDVRIGVNRFGREAVEYKGLDANTKKVMYIDCYGGKFVENIVQSIARDLLAFSINSVERKGYKTVLHVHDEIGAEIDKQDAKNTLENMIKTMLIKPNWAATLPLDADGFISEYYKK